MFSEASILQVSVLPITGIAKPFTYSVPQNYASKIAIGSLVKIPLLNRICLGIVCSPLHNMAEANAPIASYKLKSIHSILYDTPILTEDLTKLIPWIQTYYAAPIDSVYETMIPASIRNKTKAPTQKYLRLKKSLSETEYQQLQKKAPQQAILYEAIERLHRSIHSQVANNKQIKNLKTQENSEKNSKDFERDALLQKLKLSVSTVHALIRKGILEEQSEIVERTVYDDDLCSNQCVSKKAFELNTEQASAIQDIVKSLEEGRFKVHLLHGVTGSGKTEVYLGAIRHILQKGGGVIFLVPEIALAPQTVERIRSRLEDLGAKTVVWHSHLSDGERSDAWFSLVRGEAQVVVGARSSVFAPVKNLKLIVVDEEHEPAFKQEKSPRYHGRDVAVYRAMLSQAVCVLGSATPSLESLYNVTRKNYKLNKLTQRVDHRQLPIFHIIDRKRETLKSKGPSILSTFLVDKLRDRFEKREQSILFINRRGYSTHMICPDCGHVETCSHCSIAMTYHRIDERLKCHLCGHQIMAPSRCPNCQSGAIQWRGFGTQKIEDVIEKILPKVKTVRMDADTMSKKNLFREVLNAFRIGKIDILIGTQMIAKGLDFPNVTLVGLVDADISLHMQDFRANERTFQLLVQVAGRAGRGEKAGEVVVQTFTPHSAPIQFARRADFDGFLLEELHQRKEFQYPPFRHIIRHLFRSRNREKVAFYAEQWARFIEKKIDASIEIRGPAPSPIEKIQDYYRFQIWFFTYNVSKTMQQIIPLRASFPLDKEIVDVFDVDPVNMS